MILQHELSLAKIGFDKAEKDLQKFGQRTNRTPSRWEKQTSMVSMMICAFFLRRRTFTRPANLDREELSSSAVDPEGDGDTAYPHMPKLDRSL